MQRGNLLTRLLLALTLVGLVMAPFQGADAATKAVSMAAAAAHMDMSCCPDGQPMKADCGKDCPAAQACTATGVSMACLSAAAFILRPITSELHAAFRQAALTSLAGEPLPRPPRA
jgi:hypothetical protein